VIQCTGASKWVPECSPVVKSFQYQAGPRSSYLLISCRANGAVLPNGSGSLISGVRRLQPGGEVDDLDGGSAHRGDERVEHGHAVPPGQV
jgi:hypothetical protein